MFTVFKSCRREPVCPIVTTDCSCSTSTCRCLAAGAHTLSYSVVLLRCGSTTDSREDVENSCEQVGVQEPKEAHACCWRRRRCRRRRRSRRREDEWRVSDAARADRDRIAGGELGGVAADAHGDRGGVCGPSRRVFLPLLLEQGTVICSVMPCGGGTEASYACVTLRAYFSKWTSSTVECREGNLSIHFF